MLKGARLQLRAGMVLAMERRHEPHRLLRRWEDLGRDRQIPIAFPVLFVLVTAIHFALPGERAWWLNLVYGFLYAFVLTAIVIAATEAERRKRQAPPVEPREP